MEVPLCDLSAQYVALKDQIDAAMQSVAAGGKYILGANVAELESLIAEYCDCEYGIGVNSGTDALHLALAALGIGPGDEVITTPFTFIATTEAIRRVGATPVFVDIDPRTFNIDTNQIEDAITARTKALLPVHLFGQPCEMTRIARIATQHGLAIVEDCAQAIGAMHAGRKVGSFGSAGCLSFFPSKNLGCFGDGGMVVTNDRDVYERVEMLRRHGGKVKYQHTEHGLNSRLDELHAAVLQIKLPRLESYTALRRQHAENYRQLLAHVPAIECAAKVACESGLSQRHVYNQFTILVEDRDRLIAQLNERKIGCAVYYPMPLHLQKVNADLGYEVGAFPVAERVAAHCLSLPMFPELRLEQLQRVAAELRQLVGTESASQLVA